MAEGENIDYASASPECDLCKTPDMGAFRIISADKVVMFYGEQKLVIPMKGFVKLIECISIIRSSSIEIEGPQTREDAILLALSKEIGREFENLKDSFIRPAGDC